MLVRNESDLLHGVRKVRFTLLGQLKFRESLWQSRQDCTVVYGGCTQLAKFVEHPQATRDGGVALRWEHGPVDVFPHTGTPRELSGGSLSSTICQKKESGSEAQPIHHSYCEGFCVTTADTSATFLVSQHPVCSVLSRAAWVKPFLCCALCAHLGRHRCLKRFLCGRHCVSVAVFASVWWGAGGQRLTAPTVVLQAPG